MRSPCVCVDYVFVLTVCVVCVCGVRVVYVCCVRVHCMFVFTVCLCSPCICVHHVFMMTGRDSDGRSARSRCIAWSLWLYRV